MSNPEPQYPDPGWKASGPFLHRADVYEILREAAEKLAALGLFARVESVMVPKDESPKFAWTLAVGEDLDAVARFTALKNAGSAEVYNEGRKDYEDEVAYSLVDLMYRSAVQGVELTREELAEYKEMTRIEHEVLFTDDEGNLVLSGDLQRSRES